MSALHRAVAFYATRVAVNGTYLWAYSEDLSKREGEGMATATQGWVQPPGTPAVGMAYLHAYETTGDRAFLDAALATAKGLLQGQLQSGGWYYYIDFDPISAKPLAYRGSDNRRARNISTLDDNTTQAALRFLMRMDRALNGSHSDIHEAVGYALTRLLGAQYPIGAWPQGFETPASTNHPAHLKASLPQDWSRTWPGSDRYWFRYTLNDDVLANVVDVLNEAASLYEGRALPGLEQPATACRTAVRKAGEFLILAQLPEPQPAWAQQYDFDMHPAWARKFEPPAVTAGESQGVIQTLLRVFYATGQARFLDPVPGALAYLRRSRLPDGRLARFYELGSNKPLYFDREYRLTYDDGDTPTHYAFKVADRSASLERQFKAARERLSDGLALPALRDMTSVETEPVPKVERIREIIETLDEDGRWVEEGGLRFLRPKDESLRVLRSATLIEHVEALCAYLRATANR